MSEVKKQWSYSGQEGTPGHCIVAQVWDTNGKCIAAIEPTDDPAEATKLAALIAAAPDLLEALSDARLWLSKDRRPECKAETFSELLDNIDATITKATTT